jgi:2-oxoglutarate ferredoxin oxidoreductase subunit beta
MTALEPSLTDLGLPSIGGLHGVPTTDAKQTAKDFTSDQEVRWCPGCGDYAVLARVRSFLPTLGSGARTPCSSPASGCSSRFPYYLNTYGMHSIHGRAPRSRPGWPSRGRTCRCGWSPATATRSRSAATT